MVRPCTCLLMALVMVLEAVPVLAAPPADDAPLLAQDGGYRRGQNPRWDYRQAVRDYRRIRSAAIILRTDRERVVEMMESDPEFARLADVAVTKFRGRRAGGKAMTSIGAVLLGLGLIAGGCVIGEGMEEIDKAEDDDRVYSRADGEAQVSRGGIVMGVMGGVGLALLIPGAVLLGVQSQAERDLKEYWKGDAGPYDPLEDRPPIRPESRRHLHLGPVANAFVVSLPTVRF